MKKMIIPSLCLLLGANIMFAQQPCGTHPSAEQISYVQKAVDKYRLNHPSTKYRNYDTLPVVVHIVYKNTIENLDDSVVISQLEVLNEDFNRLNADSVNTPAPFDTLAGSMGVWFQLAAFDPNGYSTSGITRTQTSVLSFHPGSDDIKFTTWGGIDAWDTDSYINIWVGDIGSGLLGYSQFPGGDSATDGIVINYPAFGRKNPVAWIPYNLGRAGTHELAHYFALLHIWGDDGGSCFNDDHIADTPNQSNSNFGCLPFPQLDACSPIFPGVMFMNYLDYSDDACVNLFTQGQVAHMNGVLDTLRSSLRTSNAFTSIHSPMQLLHFSCYPNPAQQSVTVSFSSKQITNAQLTLMDLQGKTLLLQEITTLLGKNQYTLPLQQLVTGTYLVSLQMNGQKSYQKLVVL